MNVLLCPNPQKMPPRRPYVEREKTMHACAPHGWKRGRGHRVLFCLVSTVFCCYFDSTGSPIFVQFLEVFLMGFEHKTQRTRTNAQRLRVWCDQRVGGGRAHGGWGVAGDTITGWARRPCIGWAVGAGTERRRRSLGLRLLLVARRP